MQNFNEMKVNPNFFVAKYADTYNAYN